MTKTTEQIVQDLLRKADYYWYDNNEDNVNPLNPDDFDPVVDKIFKATAVELKKLYSEIDDSRREIIMGLSQMLVPDQSLLPQPGYTVAQIMPKAIRFHTIPEDSYTISGQSDTGEQYEYYFTPLFEHQYPKCELVAMLTENRAIQIKKGKPVVVKEIGSAKSTAHVWLGLKIGKLEERDAVSFFLGDRIVDEFSKDHHNFHQASWSVNGERALTVNRGIQAFVKDKAREETLLDILEVDYSYEKRIMRRLKDSFLLLDLPLEIQEMKYRVPPNLDGSELTAKLEIKEPIYWFKVSFPLAVSNEFLIQNLPHPNCIPLVNRRQLDNYVVKRNYDRILLPMPTEDLFLEVDRVQDSTDKTSETPYQRVDFLNPDSRPGTYMLRGGSRVRRLNREDGTRQIQRVLEVIQDEYRTFKEEGVNRLKEDFDIIEKAINRVKAQLPDFFREKELKSTYFCVANFRSKASRLYYYYWETQGDAIRHLGDKVGLTVNSDSVTIANSKSIVPIQTGKGELSSEDYIKQLRVALLSKDKIMSRGDIELYILSRFGKLLTVNDIRLELMQLEDGQWGRGILVNVGLVGDLPAAEAELIRLELQNDLNARSAFFTHIKVALNG